MKALIILIIFIELVFSGIIFADDTLKNVQLKWEPVNNAIGYYIEMRPKNGKSLFTKHINQSKLDVKLPEGKYQYRIAIINTNNKISDWSNWFDLAVVLTLKNQKEIKKGIPPVESGNSNSGKFSITGSEFGYNFPLSGIEPAYSGSAGVSIFYEDHLTMKLFIGGKISLFTFVSPAPNFDRSDMIQGMLYFGYDFNLFDSKDIYLSPFAGYKHYYRRYSYKGRESSGSRPILSTGFGIGFAINKHIITALILEYNLIFEINPVHTLGLFVRLGYRL